MGEIAFYIFNTWFINPLLPVAVALVLAGYLSGRNNMAGYPPRKKAPFKGKVKKKK